MFWLLLNCKLLTQVNDTRFTTRGEGINSIVNKADTSGHVVYGVGVRLAGIVGSNPVASMDVCLLRVLSSRGLYDKLITLSEDS